MMTLKTDSLSEQVLLRIQQSLINGELKPGDTLPSEKDLSERFGVGKSSVREAITMLKMIGVLESKQGKYTRVCEEVKPNVISPLLFDLILRENNSQDLYEFRNMFESAYTDLAIQNATEEDKRNLHEEYARFRDKCMADTATLEDDFVFHRIILHSTHNSFTIKIGELLFDLFKSPLVDSSEYSPMTALEDHAMILRAFDENLVNKNNVVKDTLETFHRALGLDA